MSKKNPSVLWSVDQSLNASEKAKARGNIGVSLDNNAAGDPTLTFVTGKKVDSSTGVVTLNTAKVKVSDTYSSTGTDPVNGKAIANAFETLDIQGGKVTVGDGYYVDSIDEVDGIVKVTTAPLSNSVQSGDNKAVTSDAVNTAVSSVQSDLDTHNHGELKRDGTMTNASYAVVTDANKNIKTADLSVSSPATSGNTTDFQFISSVSTQANGKIQTITKNTIPKSDAIDSSSSDTLATSKAVKTAYDLANSKQDPMSATLPIKITGTTISNNGATLTVTGANAWAEGSQTTASGTNSHAEGNTSVASGDFSHAEGESTKAYGQSSHAEGSYTEAGVYNESTTKPASHAEGCATKATNSFSHAEGYGSTASGYTAHSEGYATIASGDNTHSEGYKTNAIGYCAHSQGGFSNAYGDYSHAEGFETVAGDENDPVGRRASHAEGNSTRSLCGASHAEGFQTLACHDDAHAEGYSSVAAGITSHTEGGSTIAGDSYAHAEGNGSYISTKTATTTAANATTIKINTTIPSAGTWYVIVPSLRMRAIKVVSASTQNSVTTLTLDSALPNTASFPYNTEVIVTRYGALGNISHSEGSYTAATGMYSHAQGEGTKATGLAAFAAGKYNTDTNSGALFVIGNGTDDNARSDCFMVNQSGDTYFNVSGTLTKLEPSSANPLMDGTASPGTATAYARADHVHPTDPSKADNITYTITDKTISNQLTVDPATGSYPLSDRPVNISYGGGMEITSNRTGSLMFESHAFYDVYNDTSVTSYDIDGAASTSTHCKQLIPSKIFPVVKETVDGGVKLLTYLGHDASVTPNRYMFGGAYGDTVYYKYATPDTNNGNKLTWNTTQKFKTNNGSLSIDIGGTVYNTGFTANSSWNYNASTAPNDKFSFPAASYSTSGGITTYTAGYMTGADKEKLDNMSSITSAGTDLTISSNSIKVNTTGNDYKSSVYYSFVTGSNTNTTHAYSFAGGYNSIAGGFTTSGSDYTPSTSNSAGGKNGSQTMFAYGTNCRVNMCDAFAIGVNNTIRDTGPGNNGNTSSAWYGETGSGILGSTNSITDAYHSIIIGNNNHVDHTHHHNILIGTYLGSVLGNTIVMGHHNDSCSQAPGLNWNTTSLARITGYGEAHGGTSYVARNIEELHSSGLLWTRIGFTASAVSTIYHYTDWINDAMAFVDTSTTIPIVRARSLDYTDANNFEELAISMTHTALQVGYNSVASGTQKASVVKLMTLDLLNQAHTYTPVLEFTNVGGSGGIIGLGQVRSKNPATNGTASGGSPTAFGSLSTCRVKLYANRQADAIESNTTAAYLGNLVTGTISVRYITTSRISSASTPLIASEQEGELTFIYNNSTDTATKIYICNGSATPTEYSASSYVTYGQFTILMTTTATTYVSGAITAYGRFAKIDM